MRPIVMALAAAAGFGMLIGSRPLFEQLPSSDQGSLAKGAPWAASVLGGDGPAGAAPIPRPPAGEPARSSDPSAVDRALSLRSAYTAAVGAVSPGCHLSSNVLAAIGQVESGSGGGRSIGADDRLQPPLYGPVLDGAGRAAVADTDGGSFDGNAQWDSPMGLMQVLPARCVGRGATGVWEAATVFPAPRVADDPDGLLRRSGWRRLRMRSVVPETTGAPGSAATTCGASSCVDRDAGGDETPRSPSASMPWTR